MMKDIPYRIGKYHKSKKIVTCRFCGKNGNQPADRYDTSENTVGSIRICIVGGHVSNVLCCVDCISIGKPLTRIISTGFNNIQDYICSVQKKMRYSCNVSYIYRVNKGEVYDNMAPVKKEKYYKHVHNDYSDYSETYSIADWEYYRQMSDGEWTKLPNIHSYKMECDEKYKKPFNRIETFTGYSHKPFKQGMVIKNTNICFNMNAERIDNPHLVKLIGKDSDNNWIGVDYYYQYEKSVALVENWWKKQVSKYYGPKNKTHKTDKKSSTPSKTIEFNPFYRVIGFQSIDDCVACGGFTTNEQISKGEKCIVCTHYKIDESYCSICDKKKTKEGTHGCPGCWKIPM